MTQSQIICVCITHGNEALARMTCFPGSWANHEWDSVKIEVAPSYLLLYVRPGLFNTLRPRQNGRHFPDGIVKCIFLNKNVWISINISLKFVPKGLINNIPSLVQIMAWRRPGGKPLSEPMMVSLLTHICAIRPQWVDYQIILYSLPSLYNLRSYISSPMWSFWWHRRLQ